MAEELIPTILHLTKVITAGMVIQNIQPKPPPAVTSADLQIINSKLEDVKGELQNQINNLQNQIYNLQAQINQLQPLDPRLTYLNIGSGDVGYEGSGRFLVHDPYGFDLSDDLQYLALMDGRSGFIHVFRMSDYKTIESEVTRFKVAPGMWAENSTQQIYFLPNSHKFIYKYNDSANNIFEIREYDIDTNTHTTIISNATDPNIRKETIVSYGINSPDHIILANYGSLGRIVKMHKVTKAILEDTSAATNSPTTLIRSVIEYRTGYMISVFDPDTNAFIFGLFYRPANSFIYLKGYHGCVNLYYWQHTLTIGNEYQPSLLMEDITSVPCILPRTNVIVVKRNLVYITYNFGIYVGNWEDFRQHKITLDTSLLTTGVAREINIPPNSHRYAFYVIPPTHKAIIKIIGDYNPYPGTYLTISKVLLHHYDRYGEIMVTSESYNPNTIWKEDIPNKVPVTLENQIYWGEITVEEPFVLFLIKNTSATTLRVTFYAYYVRK